MPRRPFVEDDKERAERQERESNGEAVQPDPAKQEQPDVVENSADGADSGLVETPENAPKPKRTRSRKKAPAADEGEAPQAAE